MTKRVAILLGSLGLGGAERQGLLLAEGLRERGDVETRVFGLGDPGPAAAAAAATGLPWRALPRVESRWRLLCILRVLRAAYALRRWGADAVVPFTAPANLVAGLGRAAHGARAMWNQRDAGMHRPAPWLERRALQRIRTVVANGPESAAFLARDLGLPAGAVRTIPNGVAAETPREPAATVRARLGVPAGAWLATMVANLAPAKDHATLLRGWAAADLASDGPARLLLAGRDDGTGPGLRALARELGIADQVVFAGPVHDVAGLHAASDVVVFCSRGEGCPNAVLEAMAAGRAVIASAIPAVRAVVPAACSDLLVEDDAGWARVLLRARRDPAVVRAAEAANRARAADFSCAAMVDGFARALGLGPAPAGHVASPTLAILIPTKNRHASLARSLRTVARAASEAGAVIVICDQSDLPFAAPAGITVLHRPDLSGLPAARNALLGATDADVACFIDDDTDLAADFALRLRDLAGREPGVVAWGPVVETRALRLRRLHRSAQFGVFRDPRRLTARSCDRGTSALFGCCFAVRRQAALRTGFDASRPGYALGEDLDFFLRLPGRKRFATALRAVHRRDGSGRADALARGRAKADFLTWLARRHGGANPATLVHLLLALSAAASGRGQERGSWRGVLAGALDWLRRA
jgi:glycosyltransferase involved in cell wall biosynthesis/GT2 family glycosyltransferase